MEYATSEPIIQPGSGEYDTTWVLSIQGVGKVISTLFDILGNELAVSGSTSNTLGHKGIKPLKGIMCLTLKVTSVGLF